MNTPPSTPDDQGPVERAGSAQDDDFYDDDAESGCCTWCGGEGTQESDDPLWDDSDEVPCKACGGTGLASKQTIW